MDYEEMEKMSLEESKRQTKERKEIGLNMIRPFTYDEKKLLWDGLREDNKTYPGKEHFYVSLVKSVVRLVGCVVAIYTGSVIMLAIFLAVAELIGVVEELV